MTGAGVWPFSDIDMDFAGREYEGRSIFSTAMVGMLQPIKLRRTRSPDRDPAAEKNEC
jgi:hypothetical protein